MLCLGIWIAEMVRYDVIFHSVHLWCSCLFMTDLGQHSDAYRAQISLARFKSFAYVYGSIFFYSFRVT